jgi:hypothetical protein
VSAGPRTNQEIPIFGLAGIGHFGSEAIVTRLGCAPCKSSLARQTARSAPLSLRLNAARRPQRDHMTMAIINLRSTGCL